jgi:periplasmic protein CpxP/Spy
MMCYRARSVTRTFAALALPMGIAFVGLSGVASRAQGAITGLPPDKIDTTQDSATPSRSANAPAQQDRTRQPAFDPIAERLKYLHDRLRITPAQEPLWADLAQVMRENAKAIESLAKQRLQPTPNRTAVETLSIYEKLGEVQMDGLKKFLSVFQALYNGLSDQQKKIADVLFRTSPLSMVGSIPALPEQLFEPPSSTVYAYNALPPLPGPPVYPSYQYSLPYPAYPYYPPWVLGPPIGLGPSFFLLVPRHFHHHRSFVPFRPPVRMGPTVSPVAPPVAPRPPPVATPQAAQNQKLLNQLGFRPSR